MKSLRLLPLLLCLLFALSPTTAQETTDTGWPIEERCLAEPTQPPDGWTFPGAILMTGRYGIHAVSETLPTPYVVVFQPADTGLSGTGLSPDGKWYALLTGKSTYSEPGDAIMGASVVIDGIEVYSTVEPRKSYRVEWINEYWVGNQGLWHKMYWFDNQHLLYENALINPFTGEHSDWTGSIASTLIFLHPSPDWTRAVYDARNERGQVWVFTDGENTKQLVPEGLFWMSPVWKPDSSQFVTEMPETQDDMELTNLILFDDEGNPLETIMQFPESGSIRTNIVTNTPNLTWSPDGRYLAFVTTTFADPTINLYIADMQEKRVYDTCIETSDGLAWSPDSNMLAMMDFYDYKPHRPVMVLDIDTWALHTVAYHAGSVIGWRGD